MSTTVRNFLVRVKVNGVNVETSEPVKIQQQLEGAVTSVAEFTISGTAPDLATNMPVTIHHINKGFVDYLGNYDSRQLYTGVINKISGVGSPHGVSVSCTGPLARLRRTRPDDWSMRGKTDIEVVKYVLSYCGVPYYAADIDGQGYNLGGIDTHGAFDDNVYTFWKAGTSGASVISELDRVFGCATEELGDGRVIRFRYSLAPYDYADPHYRKTFHRGQAGVSFYGNERDRGDIDQIQNFWNVKGLSFVWGEGEDFAGCTELISATAEADHPKLGPGVDVGPQEFSSDLIDTEPLAKAIAIRLMHWYNREPDTVRILCGNDASVWPGSLILVKDSSYGIDLPSDRRYIVTGINREGDTMLLDCIGGADGAIGSVHSFDTITCNDTTSDHSTDHSPTDFGDPQEPDIPPLSSFPDVPVDEPPPPEPKDTTTPMLECTMVDDKDATGIYTPPSFGPSNYVYWEDMISSNFRTLATRQVAYHIVEGGESDYLAMSGASDLWLNTTAPLSAKTTANDFVVGGPTCVVSVSGDLMLVDSPDSPPIKAWFAISLLGYDADLNQRHTARIEMYAPIGATGTDLGRIGTDDDVTRQFGIEIRSENWIPYWSVHGPPTDTCHLFVDCNNGGYDAEGGLPMGEWLPFAVTFDLSAINQFVHYSVGGFGGMMRDFRHYGIDFCFSDPDGDDCLDDFNHLCDDAVHLLRFSSETISGPSDPDQWPVRLRNVDVGHTTCIPNPDYIPPVVSEGV